MYIKDPFISKYQLLINGRGKRGIRKLKNPEAFVDYSKRIDDGYESLKDYNRTKERKALIVFDRIKVDMELIKN